jgi:hypothetical protein
LPLPFIDNRRHLRKPSHKLDAKVARAISMPGPARDHVTAGTFIPKAKEEYVARLEKALVLAQKALPHEKRLYKLAKNNDRIQSQMPVILRSIEKQVRGIQKEADAKFTEVAQTELKLAVKNNLFNGHLPNLHYNDVPEIRNRMKKIIDITRNNNAGPEQCRKMAHTALDEMGALIRKNQPDRDAYEVTKLVNRGKEIMNSIIARAAVAQRDIYTGAAETGIKKTVGKLLGTDTRRAAVAVAQYIADKKEFSCESYAPAAAAVLPKFVDSRTLSQSENYREMVSEARQKKIIKADIAEMLMEMCDTRDDIVQVDYFPAQWFGQPAQGAPQKAVEAANDSSAPVANPAVRSASPGGMN